MKINVRIFSKDWILKAKHIEDQNTHLLLFPPAKLYAQVKKSREATYKEPPCIGNPFYSFACPPQHQGVLRFCWEGTQLFLPRKILQKHKPTTWGQFSLLRRQIRQPLGQPHLSLAFGQLEFCSHQWAREDTWASLKSHAGIQLSFLRLLGDRSHIYLCCPFWGYPQS